MYPLLALLAIYMLFFFDTSSQTVIYSSKEINSFDDPNEGIMLEIDGKKKLDLMAFLQDENFDNEDNPYGKLILHHYTNMRDLSDTNPDTVVSGFDFWDHEIPLVKCTDLQGNELSESINFYCP